MLKTKFSRRLENFTLWTLLEDSIRASLGRFSETVKHSTTNFLAFSFNTFDEVISQNMTVILFTETPWERPNRDAI